MGKDPTGGHAGTKNGSTVRVAQGRKRTLPAPRGRVTLTVELADGLAVHVLRGYPYGGIPPVDRAVVRLPRIPPSLRSLKA